MIYSVGFPSLVLGLTLAESLVATITNKTW